MLPEQRKIAFEQKAIKISCIIPIYNEETLIQKFFHELHDCLIQITNQFEIIVIDDGSKDNSVAELLSLPSHYNLKLIKFSRNFGKEIALTAGLEHATGDATIIMDADFQHPINVLPIFIDHWVKGYDMVYGVRKTRRNESGVKRSFAAIFYWLMKKITKIDIPTNAGDFRLCDRKVVNALNTFQERNRFMKGLYAWVGFKKIDVPFDVSERGGGKSSWGFKNLTELAITGIASFSDIPLRVWGFVGFIVSGIAVCYALYFLAYTLIYGADLPGFPSIIVAVMFLGGIQLLSIGILGEYIARIFTEVKNRPKYIIENKFGFND